MKRLLIIPILMTLAACNTKQATSIGYTTFEAQQAQIRAAECVGTTPTTITFLPDLGTVQGLKIWGNYNWKTNVITLNDGLDYTKQPTPELRTERRAWLLYILSHELRHKLQKESGWTISDPSIPWASRPEEIDAELAAHDCLVKFTDQDTQK